jgi:N-acetylmuramoyl-L-alanine amidase
MEQSTLNEIDPQESSNPQRSTGGFSFFNTFQSVIVVGMVLATLFTLWTPSHLFSNQSITELLASIQATEAVVNVAAPSPAPVNAQRIGIVAGHWGKDDPGAVCPDGLTEQEVNLRIATLVKQYLIDAGYEVDLMQEFDDKLMQYKAIALVSIHADTCMYIDSTKSGFKVAAAQGSIYPEKYQRLNSCLIHRYQKTTGLAFDFNTITADMREYHAFDEIHTDTTAAIIETGFLNLDRDLLENHPDIPARGIADGILCYVRNESIPENELPENSQ